MYKDKDLKNKNQISKIEQRKNNRKKLTSAFLALILSIEGTVCLQSLKYNKSYVIKHINPFNGNSIRFDCVADYQAKKVVEFISDNEFKDKDEYNDKLPFSYREEVMFCRILCELVGSDVLLETRAKGNINILINAFINKGFERQEIINLFDLFNEFSIEKRKENISLNELKIEIIQTLKNMYLKINENKKYVSPIFYQYIVCIAESSVGFNLDEFIFEKYYFNSLKKDKVPFTKGVNMDENTYELVESIYEYYDDYIQQTNEFSRNPANTTQQRHLTKTKKIYMTKESLNEKITGMIDYLSENQKSK